MKHTKPSRPYLEQLRTRYAKARKNERTRILNEFVETSNYQRKYASALLRGRREWRESTHRIQRKRRCIYNDEDKRAVFWLADVFDHVGSKRLRVAMDNELATLRRHKHLRVSAA